MNLLPPLLLLLSSAPPQDYESTADPAQLREVLYDQQDVRQQSQAALLLVRDRSPAAEEIVHRGLRQTTSPEVFLALASAVRAAHDARFTEELLGALSVNGPGARPAATCWRGCPEAAAEALAAVADAGVVQRLRKMLHDDRADPSVRQALLWVLGRSGRKDAAALLIEQLGDKAVRCAAADALTDLTGMGFGTDCERWRSWWAQHKDVDGERWLEQRLAYQGSRARRLEGELERTRAQLVRLHQQLYSRLPVADRLGHVQAAAEQEDVVIRQLAVQWSAELLASPVGRDDPLARVPRTQQALAELLMRLSHDGSADVQRMAILALGRVPGEATFERLRSLVQQGRAPARAAAVRALAQQARAEKTARQKEVVAVLQKALDDPALEVVVEAAEDLGALGVPEAGPVLVCLLRHSSDHVRQAAVHALERVADASVLDELLAALDDPVVAVRFGLVGAVSRSATGGAPLEDKQQERLLARLQTILQKDADPGVRSRAATVLGECGDPSVLPSLWERVVAVEDSRVQEKAWAAFVEVHVRAENLDLLKEWNGTLARANQRQRRVLLLNAAYQRWQQHPGSESLVAPAAELLAGTQLELGNWSAAVPLLRVLLARAGTTLARERVLQSLLVAAEQALREGNRVAARATVAEARLYLPRDSKLAAEFDNVEKRSQQGNPKSEIGAPARAGHPK